MPTTLAALAIFLFFLPGIIGMLVYYFTAEVSTPSPFQRIVIVIIFGLATNVLAHILFDVPFVEAVSTNKDKIDISLLVSSYSDVDSLKRVFVAIMLSISIAIIQNTRIIYFVFRKLKISRRSGGIDTWHNVFTESRESWVHIRFLSGHRLVGWVRHYSESGKRKELYLKNVTWYKPLKSHSGKSVHFSNYKKIDIDARGVFISNFDEVLWIETMD